MTKKTNDEEEVDYLICSTTGYVLGSITAACHRCNCEVSIAPSGQGMLAENPRLLPICIHCAAGDLEFSDHEVMPPAPEQMEEIHQTIGEIHLSEEEVLEIATAWIRSHGKEEEA